MTDADLIARVRDTKDEAAFRELYRRHTPAVYGLIRRLTGDDADAADVVQEAWIRAAAKLGTFLGTSQFRTWLSGIALNCYREWRRSKAARPIDSGADVDVASVGNTFRAVAIDEVLGTLPGDFREVLVLHDVEGYTHSEIAAALDIEIGTSKSRLSRARRLFRACWQRPLEARHG